MAAVMVEDSVELGGMGHDLLCIWAPWARDDNEGGHSWAMGPRVAKGYHGDPPDEFWIVDKIVAPHRRDKSVYWNVTSRFYLGERSFTEIRIELGPSWPEKRIRFNLAIFCSLVEREYRDWKDSESQRGLRRRVLCV